MIENGGVSAAGYNRISYYFRDDTRHKMMKPKPSTYHKPRSRRYFLQQLGMLGVGSSAHATAATQDRGPGPGYDAAEPKLEFVFQVTLDVAPIVRFGSSGYANRGFANVVGGTIEGPRLTGRAIPNTGGDYPYIRNDNVVEFEATYLLEASDGTPILIKNRGYRHGPESVMSALRARQEVDPSSYYMRLSPTFEVAEGPHDWLTRHVLVGTGYRENKLVVFRYFMLN